MAEGTILAMMRGAAASRAQAPSLLGARRTALQIVRVRLGAAPEALSCLVPLLWRTGPTAVPSALTTKRWDSSLPHAGGPSVAAAAGLRDARFTLANGRVGVAAVVALHTRRLAPPPWLVARCAGELAAAARVNDLVAAVERAAVPANRAGRSAVCMLRRRCQAASLQHHRVLRRGAACAWAGPHPAMYDQSNMLAPRVDGNSARLESVVGGPWAQRQLGRASCARCSESMWSWRMTAQPADSCRRWGVTTRDLSQLVRRALCPVLVVGSGPEASAALACVRSDCERGAPRRSVAFSNAGTCFVGVGGPTCCVGPSAFGAARRCGLGGRPIRPVVARGASRARHSSGCTAAHIANGRLTALARGRVAPH